MKNVKLKIPAPYFTKMGQEMWKAWEEIHWRTYVQHRLSLYQFPQISRFLDNFCKEFLHLNLLNLIFELLPNICQEDKSFIKIWQ